MRLEVSHMTWWEGEEEAKKPKVLGKAYLGSGHHQEEGREACLTETLVFCCYFVLALRQNLTMLL